MARIGMRGPGASLSKKRSLSHLCIFQAEVVQLSSVSPYPTYHLPSLGAPLSLGSKLKGQCQRHSPYRHGERKKKNSNSSAKAKPLTPSWKRDISCWGRGDHMNGLRWEEGCGVPMNEALMFQKGLQRQAGAPAGSRAQRRVGGGHPERARFFS